MFYRSETETGLDALITIVDHRLKNVLLNVYKNSKIPILLLTHGRGTAKSMVYEVLGYDGRKKTVSVSIQTKNMANQLIKILSERIDFSKEYTGIAFTINVSSISNVLYNLCVQAEENFMLGSEDMVLASAKEPYHLIIAIVNSGFLDQVMTAAKKAGASGGTVVQARGLGSKEAQKYLGITIQPEKDLVLILAPKEKKLGIMESIKNEVGLNTPGTGICFSLPVDSAIGVETTD